MKALSHALPQALLTMTVALSVGLVACAPEAPTADTSPAESSERTAETTADAQADAQANAQADAASTAKIYVKDGVAIGGADPVAYFEGALADGEFVAGSADYTYEWNGVTWQFASAENRDTFAADPEQYAPQYGGYCAWAAAQNAIAAISPDAWSVVDGKLYLNANKKIQARWEKDIPGFIAQANENWPTLSMQ